MPNDVSAGYNTGRIDLSNAPGADLDWDQLFPNPELQPASTPQATTTGTTPQQTPQATQDQFFLRTDDGQIAYRTAEDAIKGIAHKDSEVAKYRQYLKENGIDPNTMQRVAQPTQSQSQTETRVSPYKYYGNPNFFEEVAQAAASRDKVKYEQLMASHAREAAQSAINEIIEPWKPTLAETNRFKAVRQTTSEIPAFREFIEGPGYKRVLDNFPLYKEMVQIGENDPVAAQRLPEVYKSMYLIYQGMNQSTAQSTTTTSTTQTTPTVRPQQTLQNSTLTPPPPSVSTSGWAESNWRGNKPLGNDARKQLIQDGDKKFTGMRFEDVGL